MRISHPIILDIEASGFGPTSYPIEIGVIFSNQQYYCSLIAPDSDWTHWAKEAEEVHGVKRHVLLEQGRQIAKVAHDLNKLLEGKTVYSDGWVVDQDWLSKLYAAAKCQRTFHFSALEMILDEQQMSIWHETKDKVISELNLNRHRASKDALIIQETFARTFHLT